MNPTPPPLPPLVMPTPRKRSFGLFLKIATICALVLVLHIPLLLTKGVLNERKSLQDDAVSEIAGIWGRQQQVNGPVLEVPYSYKTWETHNKLVAGREVAVTEMVMHQASAYFLPETLNVKGEVVPELRHRGIYDTVVYGTTLKNEATFAPDFAEANIAADDIEWTKARILTGVSDLRGLISVGPMAVKERSGLISFETVEGTAVEFMPLAAKMDMGDAPKTMTVSFDVTLHGSERIEFVPLGKTTSVALQSTWPDPSFSGAYLPVSRAIDAEGFKAGWTVSHFSRGLAQAWTSRTADMEQIKNKMDQSSFGVTFARLVDAYRLVERAQKYGVLFFVLIFAVFFLFEMTTALRIHPLQYALVGGGLCLFFLGFLALSELMAAGLAYTLAAGACTILITLYAWTFLKTGARTLVIAAGLSATYAYLYFMLKSQDYALLAGAIALFAALGLVMFFTRRINWYGAQ